MAAGLVGVVLGFMLWLSYHDNRGLMKQKMELVARIEDPKTGYVARLAQSNANVVTLREAITFTNEQMKVRDSEAKVRSAELVRLRAQLAVAQSETRQMQSRLRLFLANKPQGATLDARVRDIDARILSELKH